MPIYVDDARNPFGRMIMCHMLGDSVEEMVAMAVAIGMRAEWYQPLSHPHFDVTQARRPLAVARGAIEVDRRGIVAVKRRLRTDAAFIASVAEHHARHRLPFPKWMESHG